MNENTDKKVLVDQGGKGLVFGVRSQYLSVETSIVSKNFKLILTEISSDFTSEKFKKLNIFDRSSSTISPTVMTHDILWTRTDITLL